MAKARTLGYAISYGFVSGPAHSRGFRKLLSELGFRQEAVKRAEVIFAHSAGCWLIPDTAQPQLVVYVGMPLTMARPRSAWLSANVASFRKGKILANLNVRIKNSYYALSQPRRNLGIMRNAKIGKPSTFPKAQSVFIANRNDPWPQGPVLDEFIATKPWAFISLPGTHDAIWEDPRTYTAIINHYATDLLAQTN